MLWFSIEHFAKTNKTKLYIYIYIIFNIEFVRSEIECSTPINSRANTKTKTTNSNLQILFHRTVFHVAYSVRSSGD